MAVDVLPQNNDLITSVEELWQTVVHSASSSTPSTPPNSPSI